MLCPKGTYQTKSSIVHRTHIFPTKNSTTFNAVDVSHGMCACCHRAITGLALEYVDASRRAQFGDDARMVI